MKFKQDQLDNLEWEQSKEVIKFEGVAVKSKTGKQVVNDKKHYLLTKKPFENKIERPNRYKDILMNQTLSPLLLESMTLPKNTRGRSLLDSCAKTSAKKKTKQWGNLTSFLLYKENQKKRLNAKERHIVDLMKRVKSNDEARTGRRPELQMDQFLEADYTVFQDLTKVLEGSIDMLPHGGRYQS